MRLQLLALFASCLWMHVDARSKYVTAEEDNPYEFGFTIDGQQHRHEKKDANGIIQGEFGFITADGVYHVTVYATDENGNYRVLSMRNVRISGPLDEPNAKLPDTSQFGKGQSAPNPNPLSIVTTPAPPQRVEVVTQSNRFTTQATIKPACAGCGYVTHATPLNVQKDGSLPFQTHAGQNPKPQDVIIGQKPVQQQGQSLGGVRPDVTSSSGFDVPPGANAPFVSNPLGPSAVGQFNPQNNYPSQSGPGSPGALGGPGSHGNSPVNPNQIYNQGPHSHYPGNETGSKSEHSVDSSQGDNENTGHIQYDNTFGTLPPHGETHQEQQPQQPEQPQRTQTQQSQQPQPQQQPQLQPQQPQQPQLQSQQPQQPQSHQIQQPQLPPQSQAQPQSHFEQPQGQQTPQPQSTPPQPQQQTPQLQSHPQQQQQSHPPRPQQQTPELQSHSQQTPQSQPQQPYQHPQYTPQSPQTQKPQVSGGNNAHEPQADPLLNPLSINNPPNHINQPSPPTSGITVSNGVINVPNNPPITIQDKYPNMVDGLPAGIKEGDITDLLYRFNYTVGFHGHYEKGYKNGAKVGGYFVTDRDGVSRVVTYVADENGYRPKVKFIRLDLTSDLVPKEGTEKTFGLKNFEFVWYPLN